MLGADLELLLYGEVSVMLGRYSAPSQIQNKVFFPNFRAKTSQTCEQNFQFLVCQSPY